MSNDLRQFYNALDREEAILAAEIAVDKLGIFLRVAINELDLDFEGSNEVEPFDELRDERSYLMRIGTNRAIKLALEAHTHFDAPTLTFQRNPVFTLPALKLIRRLAVIEHGRRVAQSVAAGFGRIEQQSNGQFFVILPHRLVDLELHERELDQYYLAEGRRVFAAVHKAIVDVKIGDEVRALVRELVYPYATHFIGYESDPKIDVYFFGQAYNEIEISKGFDTFHFTTQFGGMLFQHYKLAATFVLSAAIRHRAFVQALMEKSPSTRIEDVLTVSVETKEFLESMRDFINYFGENQNGHVPVTDDGVKMLFDVLSISRRNTDLLDRPGAPIPPLVQCSDDHVIRPIVGAQSDIMLFLLNSLQRSFPKEYDRAQGKREAVMQNATIRVLRSVLPDLEYRDNIKLRQGRKLLTDIDLVVIEPLTGRVLLVQLKHQDPYGADIAARQLRTVRLNGKVAEWLARVREWLAAMHESELRSTLRLPKFMPAPSVSLLVLTRHYAHSLRGIANGEDSIFANWNQLITAIERRRASGHVDQSLDDLLAELRILSAPEKEEYLPEPPSEWEVGDVRFSVQQVAD